MLAHGTDLVERLDAAETTEEVLELIRQVEAPFSSP